MSAQTMLSPITFTPKSLAGLDHAADRFLVGPGHDHDVRRAGLGHHLGFEIAAVHRLQIGDDRRVGKSLAQGPHAVHALGDDQRRAGFQPIDAGPHGQLGGLQGFVAWW